MIQQLRSILGLVLVTCLGFFCGVLVRRNIRRSDSRQHLDRRAVRRRTDPVRSHPALGMVERVSPDREIVLNAAGTDLRITGVDLGVGIDMEEAERLIDRILQSQTLIGARSTRLGLLRLMPMCRLQ